MVAAQVLFSLWAAGVATAAPQLDFGGTRGVTSSRVVSTSSIDQNQVVSDVVSALQPSIAQAVADALAGLRSSSFTSSSSSSSSSSSGARGQTSLSSGAPAGPTARPEYNFEYKVADNDAQTYISQAENRDGDSLTGTYSYVNPAGALITVNYEAGPMGFTPTVEQHDGFVDIKPQPVKSTVATSSTSSASGSRLTSSSSGSRFSGATSSTSNVGSSSSSSSIDQNALIAQIIAALQPQINSAVQSAISTSSVQTGVSSTSFESSRGRNLGVSSSGSSSGNIAGTFGDGISVSIDTPDFNIAY